MIENEFYISWKRSTALTKIKFSQKSSNMAEKEFIVGNFGDFLKVPFSEFSDFQKLAGNRRYGC